MYVKWVVGVSMVSGIFGLVYQVYVVFVLVYKSFVDIGKIVGSESVGFEYLQWFFFVKVEDV